MATTSELQLVIKAKDDASKTIKSTNNSLLELSSAVAIGTAAYEAFKVAAGFVVDQLKDTVNAASEAQVAEVKTDAILKTLNTSLAEQSDLFNQVSKSAIQMGFDDEEASIAVAKLWQITGDATEAQDLFSIAMDLSRYKGIELDAATQALTLAYSGNTRMLKQLGIEVDENASKTEIFGAIQEKVAGQAEAYSETYAGSMATMKVSIENVKEAIGTVFLQALSDMSNNISTFVNSEEFSGYLETIQNWLGDNVPKAIDTVKKYLIDLYNKLDETGVLDLWLDLWNNAVNLFVNDLLPTIKENKDMFIDIGKVLAALIAGSITSLLLALNVMIKTIDLVIEGIAWFREALNNLSQGFQDVMDNIGKFLGQAMQIGIDFIGGVIAGLESARETLYSGIYNIFQGIVDNVKSILGISSPSKVMKEIGQWTAEGFTEGVLSGIDDATKAIAEYKQIVIDGFNSIKEVKKEFKATMKDLKSDRNKDIADSIVGAKERQKEISGLMEEERQKMAEIAIEYNEKIKKEGKNFSQEELDNLLESSHDKLSELGNEYKEKEAFLKKHIKDQEKYAKQIQELEYFNSLDEIEQTKYLYNKQKEIEKQNFLDKIANIKENMREKLSVLKDAFLELSADTTFRQIFGSLKEFVSNAGAAGISLFASGGIVTKPTLAMVGEAGPEAIVPLNNNNSAISVNFNNVNVRNQNDLSVIINAVKSSLNIDLVQQQLGV